MAKEKASAVPSGAGFNLKNFIRDVINEMKKVSWISRRELAIDTGIVAVAVVIVCTLVWVCDTVFNRLFTLILR